MTKKYAIANWKMNLHKNEISKLTKEIVASNSDAAVKIVLAPPYPYLGLVAEEIAGSGVELSAQNCAAQAKGAFTGEVSASQLSDIGCKYSILGHSERRSLFFDTIDVVSQKIEQLETLGIIPIACIGESEAERNSGKVWDVLKQQLTGIYAKHNQAKPIIIAYEPVWAIGTGVSATTAQVGEVHKFIKDWIEEHDSHGANSTSVLYGGSVKPDNAAQLLATPAVDGFLIGGASLKAADFQQIIDCF